MNIYAVVDDVEWLRRLKVDPIDVILKNGKTVRITDDMNVFQTLLTYVPEAKNIDVDVFSVFAPTRMKGL